MTFKPSPVCYELIMHFEGLRLAAYYDSVNVVTIGIGTTRYEDGSKVKITDKITKERALQLLEHDMTKFAQAVNRLVRVNIHQHHFDALVSFAYNVGIGNLETSTLLKKLNKGDFDGAAAEFPRWNKAGGRELAGLTRRREAERVLFDVGMLKV